MALAISVSGCTIPGQPKPSLSLTVQILTGQWVEWSRNLGPTGIVYEFHEDGTMKLSDFVLEEELLIGKYEIMEANMLRLEWIEPSFHIVFGETIWQAVSVSVKELTFQPPYPGRITLKRIM